MSIAQQLLPYAGVASVAALALVAAFALPIALYALGALRAWRSRQRSLAARAAIGGLTLLATSIVKAGAAEVADLKDPSKPGRWDAAAAARIFQRAVYDLGRVGAGLLAELRAVHGLTPAAAEALLEATVEAQVRELRALQGVGARLIVDPSELARVEGLHDLAASPASLGGPLRGATLPLGLAVARAPHGSRAGEPPRDPSSPAR